MMNGQETEKKVVGRFTIERNVAIAPQPSEYPLAARAMESGDSIYVDAAGSRDSLGRAIRAEGFGYRSRAEGNGYRVWKLNKID